MRPIVLNPTSPHEMAVDRSTGTRIWQEFLANGSTHSARASTLPYLMRRCEREGIPYVLTAHPGVGYRLEWRPKPLEPKPASGTRLAKAVPA